MEKQMLAWRKKRLGKNTAIIGMMHGLPLRMRVKVLLVKNILSLQESVLRN